MDRKNFHNWKERINNQGQGVKSTVKWPAEHLVDFQTFKLDYWPHFPDKIIKHISVDLVFAEVMGVIKGSAVFRKSLLPLSRE